MTRLVDADALKPLTMWVTDDEGIDRPVVRLTDIDNEPTVCCEQCEHWRPQDATGDPNDCCCGNEVLAGHMEHGYNPPARFGCSNWKRRQP